MKQIIIINSYKYHQIEINTILGLVGSVKLNGDIIHDFDNQITQLSRNIDLKQLKAGVNKLELIVLKIPADIELGYFDESAVTIIFHCTNEKVFPSKETEFFKILWNPEQMKTKIEVEYLFNLILE